MQWILLGILAATACVQVSADKRPLDNALGPAATRSNVIKLVPDYLVFHECPNDSNMMKICKMKNRQQLQSEYVGCHARLHHLSRRMCYARAEYRIYERASHECFMKSGLIPPPLFKLLQVAPQFIREFCDAGEWATTFSIQAMDPPAVQCNPLPGFENGHWNDTNCGDYFRNPDKCAPVCDRGFILSGTFTPITCDDQGVHDYDEENPPVCTTATQCDALPAIANGGWDGEFCTQTFMALDVCTPECNEEYTLVWSQTAITCDEESTSDFDEANLPVCEETNPPEPVIICDPLPIIPNGEWYGSDCTSDFRHPDPCYPRCDYGFILSGGTDEITCSAQGSNNYDASNPPVCSPAVACTSLPEITDGAWDSDDCTTAFMSPRQCNVMCDEGFVLDGFLDTITCDEAGVTNFDAADPPACSVPVACDPLPEITEATWDSEECSTDFIAPLQCSVVCNDGFVLDGFTDTITCDAAGATNYDAADPPTCVTPVACTSLPEITDGEWSSSECTTAFIAPLMCSAICDEGFEFGGFTDQITCDAQGNTNFDAANPPTCTPPVAVPCTTLPVVTDGTWSDADCTVSFASPLECSVTCDAGTVLGGFTDTITCDADGNSNYDAANPPTCSAPVACTSVEAVADGAWSDAACETAFIAPLLCTVTCDAGFTLSGFTDTITCDAAGVSNYDAANPPVCSAPGIACTSLPAMTDGAWSDADCTASFMSPLECTVTCDAGFALSGFTDAITCDAAGVSNYDSTNPPTCVAPVACASVAAVTDGAWSDAACETAFVAPLECTVTCDATFVLSGFTDAITCDAAGVSNYDSANPPTCVTPVACTSLEAIPDGVWSDPACETAFLAPLECTVTCDATFTLGGFTDPITCDADGTSNFDSGNPPVCEN